MTQEEKAKAYDEALEIAKKNYVTTQDLSEGSQIEIGVECFKNILESIFPELKESEDERIRKELTEFLKNASGGFLDSTIQCKTFRKWYTWLEKLGNKPQGKSALEAIREEKVDNANKIEPKDYSCIDPHFGKPIDKVEPKFKVGDIVQYITDSTDRRKIEEIDTLCNMYHTDSSPIMFENEDEWKAVLNSENVEQNLSYKVESKFKVGDWITNGDYTWKIISVDNFDYTLQNQWGECVEDTIVYVNDVFHLWTIKDAKNGDVLVDIYGNMGVYKKCDALIWESYFSLGCHGGFQPFKVIHENEKTCPAIKELRELLSQKMKEAGYKWDAEKKELIKEEVK
jgi:hypothetical protein